MHANKTKLAVNHHRIVDFLIFLGAILVYGLYAVKFKQDVNWDLLDYHFYNGYAALHNRISWDIAPAMVQSYQNPIYDMFNYLLISSLPAVCVIFFLGAVSGLNVFLLYKLSQLLFAHLSPVKRFHYFLYAALIGGTGAAGVGILGMVTNDNYLAFFALLTLYLTLKSVITPKTKRILLMLAGLIAGFTMACKLVATVYALGLFTAFLFSQSLNKTHLKNVFIYGSMMLIGFLLADGWWMYKVYQAFSSPLFPYFNNIFHSPLAQIDSYKDPHFIPDHFFSAPYYLATTQTQHVSDAPIRDPRLFTLSVLSMIFFVKYVYQRMRVKMKVNQDASLSHAWRLIIIWYMTAYTLWYFQFTIYRFTVPLELVSGLFIIAILKNVLRKAWLFHTAAILLMVLFYQTTIYPNWGRIPYGHAYFKIENIPTLPSNAVVMFFSEPLAYVIPYFSEDVHFVGTAFTVPMRPEEKRTQLIDRVSNLLQKNKDRIYVLYDTNFTKNIQLFSDYYGLTVNQNQCRVMTTNISRYVLCSAKLKG